jgi:hypothetical protein
VEKYKADVKIASEERITMAKLANEKELAFAKLGLERQRDAEKAETDRAGVLVAAAKVDVDREKSEKKEAA